MSYCALVRLSCNVARPSFKSSAKKILNIEHLNKTVSFKLVSHANIAFILNPFQNAYWTLVHWIEFLFALCKLLSWWIIKFLFTESVKCFQKWLKKVDSNPSPRRKSSVWCCRTQSCRLVDGWNRRNVFWSCSPRYWFPIRTRKLSTVSYTNIVSKSQIVFAWDLHS